MYDDIVNEDKTVGEAIAHNGLVIGSGAAVTALGAVLLTPGVGVGIGIAVVATGTIMFVDYFYENNDSFQGFMDSIGEAIQSSFEENPVITVPVFPSLGEYDE